MFTWGLPKIGRRVSSALIIRLFFGSCRLFFLMYTQSFLVSSVRGSGLAPTTSERAALGVTGAMNAAFGFRPLDFFFAVFLAAVFFVDLALLDAVFFFALLAMLSLAPLTIHARGARSVCVR